MQYNNQKQISNRALDIFYHCSRLLVNINARLSCILFQIFPENFIRMKKFFKHNIWNHPEKKEINNGMIYETILLILRSTCTWWRLRKLATCMHKMPPSLHLPLTLTLSVMLYFSKMPFCSWQNVWSISTPTI